MPLTSLGKRAFQHLRRFHTSTMAPVLIVGATRGLGAELTKQYAKQGKTVYGTARSEATPKGFPDSVKWLPNVDLTKKDVGDTLVSLLGGAQPLESVVCQHPFLPCWSWQH